LAHLKLAIKTLTYMEDWFWGIGPEHPKPGIPPWWNGDKGGAAHPRVVEQPTTVNDWYKDGKICLFTFFSKSGLAGQHIYSTPIVSASLALTFMYKHHLMLFG
jgi:hypothetical protein